MVRRYLQCDICGDKWDITDTKLNNALCPTTAYISQCIKDGKRQYKIYKATVTDDERTETDAIDICDRCYNAIEKFMYSLKGV